MSKKELLSDSEIQTRLSDLPDWQLSDNRLTRDFEFKDFQEAFGFMAAVACVAERLFHHPDWSNTYNKVSIAITNHSQGGLTELDFEFASRVSELALTFLDSGK